MKAPKDELLLGWSWIGSECVYSQCSGSYQLGTPLIFMAFHRRQPTQKAFTWQGVGGARTLKQWMRCPGDIGPSQWESWMRDVWCSTVWSQWCWGYRCFQLVLRGRLCLGCNVGLGAAVFLTRALALAPAFTFLLPGQCGPVWILEIISLPRSQKILVGVLS